MSPFCHPEIKSLGRKQQKTLKSNRWIRGNEANRLRLIATLCLCLCSEKLAADERATVLNSDNVKGSPPFPKSG